MQKFIYNEEFYRWERDGRTQEYRGVKITTVEYHQGVHGADNHREYRLEYPDGKVTYFPINKRGGNIANLKSYIDYKIKYGFIAE